MRAFVTGGSGFIGGRLIERLRGEGWEVRGLARSDASAAKVAERGAEPVRGDLDDVAAMRAGGEGCEYAFHAAAALGEWGRREDFERGNVAGTRNALDAARAAGVRRFVHVGTEAALLAGQPLVDVDETAPLRPDSKALYPATKAQAEQAVRDANGDGFETVVVRPRLVWGVGDTTILPGVAAAVRSGRFRWIGGGGHLTSTTHVDNTVEGLVLGATKGRPGGVYFVTDGEPVVFREFIAELLDTQGIAAPDKDAPEAVVRTLAPVLEAVWGALRRPGPPPVTRLTYWLSAQECTIDISLARRELGYDPVKTREQGMAELRAAA
ncbi:MAG TPA: NAD-dependent epimerase/dehydratase family protein [Solirubrobacteraceae bacterium]|nr:NAD-dependent epimerase/dehydratase family protein [Solirubrobacteraceae bacterium]